MRDMILDTLSKYTERDVVIICNDSLVSHGCAAAIKLYYDKLDKDETEAQAVCLPNRVKISTDLLRNKKIAFFVCTEPSSSIVKYCKDNDIQRVHLSQERRRRNRQAHSVNALHIISDSPLRLCEHVWRLLFTEDVVPTCLQYIDDYVSGNSSSRSDYFYYGMTIMETCPNISQQFWESLFDCRENLPANASEDEIMERMKWDAMLQVINMGTIVKAYNDIRTEQACDNHFECNGLIFINAKDCVKDVLLDYFKDRPYIIVFQTYGMTYHKEILFEYTVYANAPEADALALAEKYGGTGSYSKATFLTTVKPDEIEA